MLYQVWLESEPKSTARAIEAEGIHQAAEEWARTSGRSGTWAAAVIVEAQSGYFAVMTVFADVVEVYKASLTEHVPGAYRNDAKPVKYQEKGE